MSTSDSFEGIEALFIKYKKEIFTYYIWGHLFDDDIKYEDKDIFEKTEKYIRDFFVKQKYEWNDVNREKVHALVLSSDNAGLITDYFQKSYDKCLETKLNWTPDSSIQRMVNHLIDESIKNNTKLSYYYAKRLLVKYYYDKYIGASDKEKIIGNVMTIFFTTNDVQRLIKDTHVNLDTLIGQAYHRLNELLGVKIDPKFFIRKFVMLKSFHVGLMNNIQLIDQLKSCQYMPVYKDLLETINAGVTAAISKNNQTVQPEEKESSGNTSAPSPSTSVSNRGTTNVEEPKASSEQKEVVSTKVDCKKDNINNNQTSGMSSEDPLDIFLKKIGGRSVSSDPIVELLLASAEIISVSEEHSICCETLGPIYYKEELEDDEIDSLLY